MNDLWFVYIIECKDAELYVGIAKNVQKRLALHNGGQACRYTKFRRPVLLKYEERVWSYADARKREKELKGHTRSKKLELIESLLCKNG